MLVYFTGADCANEVKRAIVNRGRVFRDKFSIGQYGFISLIADPDGNMIGLHLMK
jgi:hypothetical protein